MNWWWLYKRFKKITGSRQNDEKKRRPIHVFSHYYHHHHHPHHHHHHHLLIILWTLLSKLVEQKDNEIHALASKLSSEEKDLYDQLISHDKELKQAATISRCCRRERLISRPSNMYEMVAMYTQSHLLSALSSMGLIDLPIIAINWDLPEVSSDQLKAIIDLLRCDSHRQVSQRASASPQRSHEHHH